MASVERAEPEWVAALRDELLPALARADLRIDARVRLNLEAWLDAARQRGELGADAQRARNAVRAIVCKSKREQDAFDQAFDRWIDDLRGGRGERPERKPRGGSQRGPSAGDAETGSPWRRFVARLRGEPARIAASLLVAAALATGGWLLYRWFDRPDPPHPPRPPAARLEPPANPDAPPALDLSRVKPVSTPIEIRAPQPAPWLFGIHPAWYAAIVAALASLGYAVRTARRKQVARISVNARRNLRELEVFAKRVRPPASGARRQALRGAARMLRRPVEAEGRLLDVRASVLASARAAGRFDPVWRERRVTPEYVALIDRCRPAEPLGQLAWEMVRALACEGVSLHVYEFDRDPRWIAPVVSDHASAAAARHRYEPLSTLAARHGGQAMLVFSDGHGLADTTSGTLHEWVGAAFAPWPRRALLTPVPPAGWGPIEDLLAGEGEPEGAESFLLLPAQTYALPALAQWLRGEAPEIALIAGAPGPLPALLAGGTARWLGAHGPDANVRVRLLRELQAWLGPTAYTWLAASAAYPHLSADLTRLLADELSAAAAPGAPTAAATPPAAPPDPRLLEARLVALAYLPWFRQGAMPDWLRAALLRSVPPAVFRQIRTIVSELVKSATGKSEPGTVSLGKVAGEADESAWRRIASRFNDWRQRARIGALAEDEPDDSPLRDVIYVGVLRGDIDPMLAFDAPDAMAEAAPAGIDPPLTRNPLRWLAAGIVVVVHALLLVRWAAGYALRGGAATEQRRAAPPRPERAEAAAPVFISFARADVDLAGALVRALRVEHGIETVSSDTGLTSHDDVMAVVVERIDRCDVVLALVTGDYLESAYVEREWVRLALERGKRVVQVVVGSTEPLHPVDVGWNGRPVDIEPVRLLDESRRSVQACAEEIASIAFAAARRAPGKSEP